MAALLLAVSASAHGAARVPDRAPCGSPNVGAAVAETENFGSLASLDDIIGASSVGGRPDPREFESSSEDEPKGGKTPLVEQSEYRKEYLTVSSNGTLIPDEKRNAELEAKRIAQEKDARKATAPLVIKPPSMDSWRTILLNFTRAIHPDHKLAFRESRSVLRNGTKLGPNRRYGLVDPESGRRIELDDDYRRYEPGSSEQQKSLRRWVERVKSERPKFLGPRKHQQTNPLPYADEFQDEFQKVLEKYPDEQKLTDPSINPREIVMAMMRGMGYNESDPRNKKRAYERPKPWVGRRGVGAQDLKVVKTWQSPTFNGIHRDFSSQKYNTTFDDHGTYKFTQTANPLRRTANPLRRKEDTSIHTVSKRCSTAENSSEEQSESCSDQKSKRRRRRHSHRSHRSHRRHRRRKVSRLSR